MRHPTQVLILDQDANSRELYKSYLHSARNHHFEFVEMDDANDALTFCKASSPSYIIVGHTATERQGVDFIDEFSNQCLPGSILYVAGQGHETAAVVALHKGAADYVFTESLSADYLQHRIESIIEKEKLHQTIYEQKRVIKDLAELDPLTSLPNRTFFETALCNMVAQAKRYERMMAVLVVEIADCQRINDVIGIQAGDEVMRQIAQRLQGLLRESDLIVRLGNEQFGIILSEICELYNAGQIAKKICSELNRTFNVERNDIHVTVSVGIATYPHAADTSQDLINNACIAAKRTKSTGKSSYQFYQPELHEEYLHHAFLENALFFALERKELFLLYQPKLDLENDRFVGIEVFLRWNHPELGAIPTGKFIPIAEKTGLIVPMGNWVIASACEQFSKWRDKLAVGARLSINISLPQLECEQLPSIISHILNQHNLVPSDIEFDLSEASLYQRSDIADKVLQQLSIMGINIAIDDFGSTFFMLNQLKRTPFSVIKIDNQFIQKIGDDSKNAELVKAVIAIANSLDVGIVAEGVETDLQRKFLLKNNCNFAQGNLFSEPLTAEEFSKKF